MNREKDAVFDLNDKRWVLVTGASAGIGKSLARVFARNDFNLILVARREDMLKALANELSSLHSVKTLVIKQDLSSPDAANNIMSQIDQKGIEVSALVNNAGYAIQESFTDATWEQHQNFIQVMTSSVVELSYLCVQGMRERSYGRIINVSSLAIYTPETAGSLYGAVKSFVSAFSKSLHMELSRHNVYCLALHPGFTYSEFHDVMDVRDKMEKLPKALWQDSEQVAEEAFEALMKGRMSLINGRLNRILALFMKVLPERLLYWLSMRSSPFS